MAYPITVNVTRALKLQDPFTERSICSAHVSNGIENQGMQKVSNLQTATEKNKGKQAKAARDKRKSHRLQVKLLAIEKGQNEKHMQAASKVTGHRKKETQTKMTHKQLHE
ncbi:hypothetical protein scyTo_0018871 [Scyliorhinus torazame]|uniref:Uncharacterized protein n=1 Tax=Scyliorhinus torazame TaxID=75743 RepID=A0A401Q3T1_SCYTO|nr:hypothetical protein [Scyliorhinus torazame]